MSLFRPILSRTVLVAVLLSLPALAQTPQVFTCGQGGHHHTSLTPAVRYSSKDPMANAGFDLVASPASSSRSACFSDKPFFFSIAEPDGNYQVTLVLGGPNASTMTVRAESRRLFVDRLQIPANGSRRVVFNVNVRAAAIHNANEPESVVKLKPRERGALDWDEKLTLEFNGDHPGVRSIAVRPITTIPTVYLAGDSTVVDQDKEPWAAWGQMLPAFFSSKVSIANEAESGETIRSFVEEQRLDKIISTIQPGDYLMLQFAHNDQKPGSAYVPAATDYKTFLRRYIHDARIHGATPILVTSMNRRSFDSGGKILPTLGDYPAAMREVAKEQDVALIDLNVVSTILYETMGEAGTLKAFVHYPANTFPDQPLELKDDTHFNSYGAYELARAVVQSIRDQKLPLAQFLRNGISAFSPAQPDSVVTFRLPPSPLISVEKPYSR